MSRLSSKPVSELLAKWEAGDGEALRALVPLIYNELRRLAHHYLETNGPVTHSQLLTEPIIEDVRKIVEI